MSEPDLTGSGAATDRPHPIRDEAAIKCSKVATKEQNWQERVEQLEKALEQSLISIGELRLQLSDRHFLETQLAATEEMANLQQHAINELRRQVTRQQQTLEVKIAAQQSKDRVFEDFLREIESLTQAQQLQIERLKSQLGRDNTVLQHDRHETARNRLETRLHYACEELRADRDRYLTRSIQLERQTAILQKQLLRQTQQVEEYEAAAHYWRERYSASISRALQLKEALENYMQNPSAGLSSLLKAFQAISAAGAIDPGISERIPLPSLKPHSGSSRLTGFLN